MKSLVGFIQRLINRLRKVWNMATRNTSQPVQDRTVLEVERKFRLKDAEAEALPAKIADHGFVSAGVVTMTDTFLPTADEEDMMRVREETSDGGTRYLLTCKTWVGTDDGGKERQESEAELGELAREYLLDLGRRLKGADLISFSKQRHTFKGGLAGREAAVTLDSVEGLGEYSGNYMEIEVIVPKGEDVSRARAEIYALASQLLGEEREPVMMSYMKMLKATLKAG